MVSCLVGRQQRLPELDADGRFRLDQLLGRTGLDGVRQRHGSNRNGEDGSGGKRESQHSGSNDGHER
jgi:hypothetical protein